MKEKGRNGQGQRILTGKRNLAGKINPPELQLPNGSVGQTFLSAAPPSGENVTPRPENMHFQRGGLTGRGRLNHARLHASNSSESSFTLTPPRLSSNCSGRLAPT